ncbi:MAG: hypothetical protein KDA75_03950, partial [Planctomycetaceae bacterium]|nr:hypothetical protein [Planctomycetaceae bacterium]
MALKHRKSWLTACTLVAIAVGVGWTFAQPGTNQNQSPAPVNLLPQEALLFVTTDGSLAHRDAWEQTAAYQAIEESGLEAMFEKVIDGFHQLAAAQGAGGFVSLGRTALIHLRDHGLSLAATVVPQQNGPPTGYAILVLHDAARFEETVAQLIMGGTQGELDFQQADKAGRTVTFAVIPDSPGVEVGWWQESGHLVLVAGIQAVDSAIAVATGEAPNATTHPLYQKYVAGEHDFEV